MINKDILNHVHKKGFSEDDFYEAYKIFLGTLVSEPRLKIINLLRKGRKNVSEIMEGLNTDQTSVSHNLARLKKCGFVKDESDGKFKYYKLEEETIEPMMEMIEKHMSQHCIHILMEARHEKN
jgi:DNA-binding transcriptional ArsR family regulator